jgi:8-oxo-dGTP diphosphatase
MKARIWITGFEPFGVHNENPSKILVGKILGTTKIQQLKHTPPFGLESESIELIYTGEILSVDKSGSRRSIDKFGDVDAVVHVGLNESAEKIRFEMCAINELNFRIPDNSGRQITEEFVDESGLALLHTTVHRPSIVHAFSDIDYVEISEDCGRFVCNETYYRTLNAIEKQCIQTRERALPAIFVHIPSFSFVSEEKQLAILFELSARIVQKPIVNVVGGVIINSNKKILACRRATDQVMAGYWEFPGGKVDGSETNIQALKRELNEELGLYIENFEHIDSVQHDYGSMIVNLEFFSCHVDEPKLSMFVHDEIRWVTEDEATSLNWLPADVEFVESLVNSGFSSI